MYLHLLQSKAHSSHILRFQHFSLTKVDGVPRSASLAQLQSIAGYAARRRFGLKLKLAVCVTRLDSIHIRGYDMAMRAMVMDENVNM